MRPEVGGPIHQNGRQMGFCWSRWFPPENNGGAGGRKSGPEPPDQKCKKKG